MIDDDGSMRRSSPASTRQLQLGLLLYSLSSFLFLLVSLFLYRFILLANRYIFSSLNAARYILLAPVFIRPHMAR